MNDILKKVEESTKYVSNNSKYVKINYDVLDEVIENGNFDKISYWLDSNPFGLLDMDYKDIINFLLVYHTIGDYCFWGDPKWEIVTKSGAKLDGSYAIMYILIERFKENKSFDMSMLTFSTMLDGNVEIPLLEERYECLVKMNAYLKKIGGDFYLAIKDIKDDITLVDYIINNLDYFKDECEYEGKKVYFYKRAQLIASDILHIRKMIENINVDYSHLMGCADYKIPQVMRCLGILEFNDELSDLVDNKVELEEHSLMEIEIRANDIVVIDYIAKKLNGKVARMDINDYIWLLSQDKSKMTKPYHRTRTICY